MKFHAWSKIETKTIWKALSSFRILGPKQLKTDDSSLCCCQLGELSSSQLWSFLSWFATHEIYLTLEGGQKIWKPNSTSNPVLLEHCLTSSCLTLMLSHKLMVLLILGVDGNNSGFRVSPSAGSTQWVVLVPSSDTQIRPWITRQKRVLFHFSSSPDYHM